MLCLPSGGGDGGSGVGSEGVVAVVLLEVDLYCCFFALILEKFHYDRSKRRLVLSASEELNLPDLDTIKVSSYNIYVKLCRGEPGKLIQLFAI